MKMLRNFFIAWVGIVFLIVGCKHTPQEILVETPNPGPIDTMACDSSNVTYPGTIVPILNAYCYSCHSGPTPSGGLDLSDFNDLAYVAQRGSLLGSIKHEAGYPPMPQGSNKISLCEIALIEKWINDTTFIIPPDTTNCDTSNITYPGTVLPIFEANCIGCHGPPDPKAGIDLTNYETVSFLAQNGALIGSINHDPGFSAMPKNGPPLKDCEIIQIQKWVNDTTFIPVGSGGIPCDPDTTYFQNDILPLLQSSCGIAGCHDPITAEGEVILTSYFYVMQTADVVPFEPLESDMFDVVTETDPDKRMPPPPASMLAPEQIDLIHNWIAQGALDNYCDIEDCDSINVSFSSTIWPIVQNNCLGCHSGENPTGGISLTNYSEVASIGAIPAGNTGSLLGSISWASGNVPMPYNANPLSDCNIAQIRKWINEGLPDN